MFGTLLFDYRVSADGIYVMLFHVLPIRLLRMDSLIDVDISSSWGRWYPPFRTLRLGNRIRRQFLVIRRRGFFTFVLLTPQDADGFKQDIERYRATAPGQAPPARDAGFTLLETLVALIIVALGFAYAFGAMPESLGAQDRARNLEAATSLAQSLLAQGAPTDGAAQKFAWHIDTAPLGAAAARQPGDFAGETERVTVRWTEGQQQRSIALQTIRLGIIPRGS